MDSNDQGAFAGQRLMMGLSGNPGQPLRQDPMLALINQAWRAREGCGDGFCAMTTPF